MKRFLAALLISGLARLCYGQGGTDTPGPANSGADSVAYYASLNRHLVELRTQYDLLSGLAQEHKKRAAETPAEQTLRAQWENDLAKELDTKASLTLAQLTSATKEKAGFERRHPELPGVAIPPVGAPQETPSPEEVTFINHLEERLAAVRQEVSDTIDAGKLYQSQLITNSGTAEFSRLSVLLQDNANTARTLQKEIADLELMRLEFRALRKER